MMKLKLYMWLLFLIAVLGQLQTDAIAQTENSPEAVELTLAEGIDLPTLIRLAVGRNPKIKAARASWGATVEKYPQVTATPDPMFMYSYFARSIETRVGPQRHRLSFSQAFPYPGTLSAAGQVAIKEVEIEQVKYELVVRDLIVELKLSYHELAYLKLAIEITKQNQELLDHILKIAHR